MGLFIYLFFLFYKELHLKNLTTKDPAFDQHTPTHSAFELPIKRAHTRANIFEESFSRIYDQFFFFFLHLIDEHDFFTAILIIFYGGEKREKMAT